MILHEKSQIEFGISFDTAPIRQNFYCICDYCGKEFLRCKKTILQCNKVIEKDSCGVGQCKKKKSEEVQLQKYGTTNVGGNAESLTKRKQTSIERYGQENYAQSDQRKQDSLEKHGVEHHMQTEESVEKRRETWRKKYGVDHYRKSEQAKEQIKETCIEKYGIEHFMMTAEFKDKVKLTLLDRYGVDHFSKTADFAEKTANTNLERYGKVYAMQADSVKERFSNTCLERYGVDHFAKTEEFQQYLHDIFQEKFGADSYFSTQEFRNKANKVLLEKYGVNWYTQTEEFREKVKKTSLQRYGVDHYAQSDEVRKKIEQTCLARYGTPYPSSCYGKTQEDIQNWLNSLGFAFAPNSTILNHKELDMYDENINLAIEYCGLYWHTELSLQPRLSDYHYNKYFTCMQKGVRLITIFEDEWMHHQAQCKNYLKAVLGKYNKKVFARKCQVVEVSSNECNGFCNANHIQGASRSTVMAYGLVCDNKLIAIMSLGRHPRANSSDAIVLNRLCFADGVQVVGGASKLFAACVGAAVQNNFKHIISWSDNRWSLGNIYAKLGFTLSKELPPDYSYVDLCSIERKSKQSCKKSNIKCPEDKTERQCMLQNGFARIWDCGKKRWVYKIDQ